VTIDQLYYFSGVQKYMNFSLAAEELCISQSTLSKQIKALEDELSVQLFLRNTRNIKCTQAGLLFSEFAQNTLEAHRKLINELKKYTNKLENTIRIVSIPVLKNYGIIPMMHQYHTKHKDIEFDICETDAEDIYARLEDVDMVIMRSEFLPHGRFKVFPLIDDELVLIANRDHPLAKRETVALIELQNEEMILLSKNTGIYNKCIDVCARAGFVPHVQHLNIRLDTIKSLVAAGEGISLLMQNMAVSDNPNLKIIPLEEHPKLTLSIVAKEENLKPACMNFAHFAIEYFRTH